MLDEADCIDVELNKLTKFNCEKCFGKMELIYYESVHRQHLNIEKNNIL